MKPQKSSFFLPKSPKILVLPFADAEKQGNEENTEEPIPLTEGPDEGEGEENKDHGEEKRKPFGEASRISA